MIHQPDTQDPLVVIFADIIVGMLWLRQQGRHWVLASGGNDAKPSRNSLTEERILDEALALVDERGLEALTTRALGQRLGVDPTAVYRHFRNKDELVNALADRIVGSGTQPPVSSDGDASPRGQLRSACLALRRALLVHPAMTAIVVRRPPRGTNTWAATEQALGLLRQAGFDDGDAAHAYQALLFYTLGHAMLEAPYASLDPAQAAAELTASRLMYQALPAGDYPNTAAVAPKLYGSLEEQFTYGLDRLLDGLGLAHEHPASQPTPRSARMGTRRRPGGRAV
jgi:TetR/AcrR family transcriptional regulator, tetracycline repressor protein